ncbi:MAG: hypothetical protein KDD82_05875 [Planctomycetes bacterium]|nr:hypothetical protein [Planctomycetota bacterium]
MKLRALVLLALSTVFPAFAQQAFVERWKARVAAFRVENETLAQGSRRVVLLGSSSMEGWLQRDRVARFLPTVGPRVLNRGISGDGIGITVPGPSGLRNRLEASAVDCQPSHVFVLNGRNSLGYGVERTAEAYRALLTELRERLPGVVVCVITCAPVNHGYADKREAVEQLNARLRAIAKETGCWLIDLHPKLVGPDGLMKRELTKDGLHFKDEGYRLLGVAIERVVRESEAQAPPPQQTQPKQGGLSGSLEQD